MTMEQVTFKNEQELKTHILTRRPTFYFSSQTSTVIPYDKINDYIQDQDLVLGDLSAMPSQMEINPAGNLVLRGAVSWKDAREFLRPKGFNIMTSPTEELALVLAGIATSCTGERCFSFGNLRKQIVSLKYLNHQGEEKTLHAHKKLSGFEDYQKDFLPYQNFKNAPFPRLEYETDLMIGTEGQLGVITEVEMKVAPDYPLQHLFMLVPRWEEDLTNHLEVIKAIQPFREDVLLCELVDANSFEYLPLEDRPNQEMDVIFFEIKADSFDHFYENFLTKLPRFDENKVFEISEKKFHHLRASIPRAVFEANSKAGVVKMGTDIQVKTGDFEKLMHEYQDMTKTGVKYNLFGHFGDAHLHFNYMPTPDKVPICAKRLEKLYQDISKLEASPFAEHGIGILKQKFIKRFWTDKQPQAFKKLKKEYDPQGQFFPHGFMGLSL